MRTQDLAWPVVDLCFVDRVGSLEHGEVHLWLFSIDPPPWPLGAAALDAYEIERARRFAFERDRRRFIGARAMLRRLLGSYTGMEPKDLRFSYAMHGKPSLEGVASLQFNLSHSHGLALLAVMRGCPVGADLEALRAVPQMDDIARQNFAAEEVAALMRLPAAQRTRAFFTCWTRKEAYVKALGTGLSTPLQRFVVSLERDAAQALRSVDGSEDAARRWTLRGWELAPDMLAAVAVHTANVTVAPFRIA